MVAQKGRSTTESKQPLDDADLPKGHKTSDAATVAAKAADEAALAEEEMDLGEPDLIVKAQAEAEEMRDRYLRLQAEWDNFRKRTVAEREQERKRAAEGLVERLLPVLDDLERAIAHSDAASAESLAEGIAAVNAKLNEVLAKEGVKVLDPVGEAFDANVHQAVGKQHEASVPDETVLQVYAKGYEMGGRMLRTPMVVVSEGGPKREVEAAEAEVAEAAEAEVAEAAGAAEAEADAAAVE